MMKYRSKGIALLEVVIGTSLMLLSLTGVIASYQGVLKHGFTTTETVQTALLLEEGLEALTLIRDKSWSNLSALTTGTSYYLAWQDGTWMVTTTPQTIDGKFTRSFVLESVYRDGNDSIAVSGTVDAGMRKATVTVAYPAGSRSFATYIAHLFQ